MLPLALPLQAKMPVLALLGVSLIGERLLVDRLHHRLEVGEGDEVCQGTGRYSVLAGCWAAWQR